MTRTGMRWRLLRRHAATWVPASSCACAKKWGLAYYVGAQNFIGLEPGYFAFYAGTTPEKAGLVEKEMLAEAEMLRVEGLAKEVTAPRQKSSAA